MLLITKIVLLLVALGGLAYSVAYILSRGSESVFAKRRWRRIGFGFLTCWGAIIDFVAIRLGYVGSFEALVGILGYVALFYAMSRVDLDDFFEQLGNIGNKR